MGEVDEKEEKTEIRAFRPSPLILSESVRRSKRRIALVTLWIPFLGAVGAVLHGILLGVGPLEIGMLVAMYAVTITGVEVGLHRYFSHLAFRAGRGVKIFLAVSAAMAAQGPLFYWCASHRRHHRHSDEPEDPHSPHWRMTKDGPERMSTLRGLWQAQCANMYTGYATNVTLFAKDLMRDPDLVFIDKHYRKLAVLGVLLPAAAGALIAGPAGALSGFLWGGLLRIFLGQHCYYANGSFAHMYGAAPYKTNDHSTNNLWFGIPTFGSAYQNNHHAFPSSAILGFKWYQPDLGAWIILAWEKLGLVSGVKRAKVLTQQADVVSS